MRMKATPRQIGLLQSYGISDPPKKKVSCWRLIKFIKEGNGTRGNTESERISLFLEAREKWIGKKAEYQPTGKDVIVTSIYPKDLIEVAATRESLHKFSSNQPPSPFNAGYRYAPPRKGCSSCSLGLLTLKTS